MTTTKSKQDKIRITLSLRPELFVAAKKLVNGTYNYTTVQDYIQELLNDDLFRLGYITSAKHKNV